MKLKFPNLLGWLTQDRVSDFEFIQHTDCKFAEVSVTTGFGSRTKVKRRKIIRDDHYGGPMRDWRFIDTGEPVRGGAIDKLHMAAAARSKLVEMVDARISGEQTDKQKIAKLETELRHMERLLSAAKSSVLAGSSIGAGSISAQKALVQPAPSLSQALQSEHARQYAQYTTGFGPST
jgi:hypothetical protein